MHDSSVSSHVGDRSRKGWLVLVHQLPAEPAYLRVKVSRRLKQLGAIALKSSVYVLPASDDRFEDFVWLRKEILEEGGEATVLEARLVEGLTDVELRGRFEAERDEEYGELMAELGDLVESEGVRDSDVRRLRDRFEAIRERDYFEAGGRFAVARGLMELEDRMAGISVDGPAAIEKPVGGVWVTREGIRVDRMASAWLIQRFIDPAARFRYVPAEGYVPKAGELRFDMYEGEFSHEGVRCTFETLVHRFGLDEPGLREIGELVHDLDFRETRFGRPEAAGLASIVAGIVAVHAADEDRRAAALPVFDALLAGFRGHGESG